MLRATLKSLLSRKLRLRPVRPGRGAGRDVRVRRVRAHRHAGPLLRQPVLRHLRRHRRQVVAPKPKPAIEDDDTAQPAHHARPRHWRQVRRGAAASRGATGEAHRRRRPASSARTARCVTTFGPPRLGDDWTGDVATCVQLREGRAPAADNEIAINADLAKAGGRQGRRPRRRADPPAGKQTFKLVGIFGYSGGRDSLGGALEVAVHRRRSRSELMLGETDVYTAIDVRPPPACRTSSCATASRPRSARGTR